MYHKENPRPADQPPSRGALNFLLVDDDQLCLFIHRRVLQLTGYCNSARVAHHGKHAIDILNKGVSGPEPMPDIILLDLEMPTMGGIAFLQAFHKLDKQSTARIAIVLVSSSASERDKKMAMSLGVVQCLSKPLTRESIEPVIELIYQKRSPRSLTNT
jgi:CheY-like chemotaxis protein